MSTMKMNGKKNNVKRCETVENHIETLLFRIITLQNGTMIKNKKLSNTTRQRKKKTIMIIYNGEHEKNDQKKSIWLMFYLFTFTGVIIAGGEIHIRKTSVMYKKKVIKTQINRGIFSFFFKRNRSHNKKMLLITSHAVRTSCKSCH